MKIEFTAKALEKPKNLSMLAELGWNYYSFNSDGWAAAEVGDTGVIVTDEGCDCESFSLVFPDEDSFVDWLETDANNQFADHPRDFLIDCGMIHPSIATEAVVDAVLAAIRQHTDH